MVAFTLTAHPTAVAIVATHGLTDLDTRGFVVPYATCLCAPVPSLALTPLFCASSVLHFADDSSLLGSAALHAAVVLVGIAWGQHAAAQAMLGYLTWFHVPAHYRRCYRARRYAGVALAAVATVVAACLCRACTSFVLGDWAQRIVIAHVLHERSLR